MFQKRTNIPFTIHFFCRLARRLLLLDRLPEREIPSNKHLGVQFTVAVGIANRGKEVGCMALGVHIPAIGTSCGLSAHDDTRDTKSIPGAPAHPDSQTEIVRL
jgi:hypothetical protein